MEGCAGALAQRGREQARLDATLRRAQGAWSGGDRLPLHGWRDGARRRCQSDFPASGRAALHRASHPQFHPIHPTQGVGSLYERSQSYLWRCERQAGARAIRAVLPRLGEIPWRCGGMEEPFHAC